MSFEYTVRYRPYRIVDYIITNIRHNEADDSVVIEYSNGESIRLSLADLVGHEA
jgi:hypothetical protein